MEPPKSRGREPATTLGLHSEPRQKSQFSGMADFADLSVLSHQASRMADEDTVDGANSCDASIDEIHIAQAVIACRPQQHPVYDMESIKARLQNLLDAIKEPQTECSSHLDVLLPQWLEMCRSDRKHALLIYVLGGGSERYKDRKLDLTGLETIDLIKTNVLEQQCSQRGACLHLAKMTSAVNADPDDVFELKMAISLHEIRDLGGSTLLNKPVAVRRESIIQKGLLQAKYHQTINRRNPYPSPSDGSPTLQTDTAKSFQDWVLVIMPEGYRFEFLADNADPQALHEWIQTHSAGLSKSEVDLAETDPNAPWGLAVACKSQLNNVAIWCTSGSNRGDPEAQDRHSKMLEAIICASLGLRDQDLFEKAITWRPRMLPFEAWAKIGSTMELANFSSYSHSLTQALANIDSFQDRYIILHSIREGCEAQEKQQESRETIDEWFQDQIALALSNVQQVEENDGAILVVVAKRFPEAVNVHRIISFAKKHSYNHKFVIEFAFSLYDELVENTIEPGQARYLLAEILDAAMPVLCRRGPQNWSFHPWFPSRALHTSVQDLQPLHADRMARLVRCCLTVGLYDVENALLRHFWLDASTADAKSLQHILLPYLKQLLTMMHDWRIPLTTPTYQWQFQQIISRFITVYIGKEPTPPTPDFTSPPLGCASPTRPYGCPTCLQLDAFLVDPHQKTADITGGIDAPEHVAAQIRGTDHLQMTVISHSAEQQASTIRITKNVTKADEPDARHELWKERVIKANDLIQAICGDEEWKLLLADRYDECMGLQMVSAE